MPSKTITIENDGDRRKVVSIRLEVTKQKYHPDSWIIHSTEGLKDDGFFLVGVVKEEEIEKRILDILDAGVRVLNIIKSKK